MRFLIVYRQRITISRHPSYLPPVKMWLYHCCWSTATVVFMTHTCTNSRCFLAVSSDVALTHLPPPSPATAQYHFSLLPRCVFRRRLGPSSTARDHCTAPVFVALPLLIPPWLHHTNSCSTPVLVDLSLCLLSLPPSLSRPATLLHQISLPSSCVLRCCLAAPTNKLC